ncbi:MAG: protein kinase, partial [Myxococcota bacterium]
MVSNVEPTPADGGPTRVGPWRLEGLLGAGGFGSVYRARDGSGRVAVVKVLRAPPGDELRALSRVHHPGVVVALGGGVGSVPYLVMALAPGVPLSSAGPVHPDDVPVYVAQLADALAACHHAGVVHGDLKPANVLVDLQTRRTTLVDFGLVGGAGGTPAWAAPEVLGGAATSPASDVYALGLMAWELLAGGPPWPELTAEERVLTRAHTAVPPVPAPPALAGLLQRMLALDPAARPTAEQVVDALEASGVPVFAPCRADVARRAAGVRIPRPFDRALVRWLSEGGALALVGAAGSGRSHALAGVANELQARGVSVARIGPATEPWGPVEAALQDESLPGPPAELPRAADPETRAEAAAEALIARSERGLSVLVDDWDALDAGTRDTVAALERQGVALLVAAEHPPAFARAVPIPAFDAEAVRQLLDAMLGSADPALAEWVGRGAPWPGPAVRGVLDAIDAGAVVWRHRAWVVDVDRLSAVQPPHHAAPDPSVLSADALRLAVVIARAQPVGQLEALELAGVSPHALSELVELGWIRDASLLTVGGEVAAAALGACAERQGIDRSLCRVWTARAPIPWLRLGPAVVGAGDPALACRFGAPALRAWLELDLGKAVELADALGGVADPSAELVAARIEVWVVAGRAADARALGTAWLDRGPDGPDAVPVLLQLARAEDAGTEDASAMAVWVDRARAALGDAPAPFDVQLAIARGLFRSHRLAEADEVCAGMIGPAPEPAALGTYLKALALAAQIRGELEGPDAGLAVLADLGEEVGRGTAERAVVELARGRLQYHAGRPRDAASTFEAAAAVRRALPLVERARLENNAALCW